MSEFYCTNCKDPCGATEETWDYPGTHCTHGQSGIHHSGNYVSDCCLEELTTDTPEEMRMNEAEYKMELQQ
tara:strand:- start:1986 stop:2198 length:213 start_codon:yes stop_codon:yes gene_type:complete